MNNIIEFPSPPEMLEEQEEQAPIIIRVQVVPPQPQAQPVGASIAFGVLSGVVTFVLVLAAIG